MRDHKIQVALIGLGGISRAHEPGHRAMADKVEIRAVCDVNEQAAVERAKPLNAKAYTNYEELVADPDIEAVDIMVPHHLHYPIAKAALLHNKHVLMEKPLTVVAADALELCQIAAERHLKFTVAENTRFVTAYIAADKLIRAGTLGDIRLVRTFIYGSEMFRLHRPNDWIQKNVESGGGAMMDMAPHSLYLLKWLFGEFEDVQATQWQYVPHIEVPDNAAVTGHFKSGGIFTTQYTETVEVPWGERLEVFGAKGSIIIDQLVNPPAMFYANGSDYTGRPLEDVPYEPKMWKVKSMWAKIADFHQAIWDDRPTTIDPLDGYYVIKAVERSYQSAEQSKALPVG